MTGVSRYSYLRNPRGTTMPRQAGSAFCWASEPRMVEQRFAGMLLTADTSGATTNVTANTALIAGSEHTERDRQGAENTGGCEHPSVAARAHLPHACSLCCRLTIPARNCASAVRCFHLSDGLRGEIKSEQREGRKSQVSACGHVADCERGAAARHRMCLAADHELRLSVASGHICRAIEALRAINQTHTQSGAV